MSAASTVPLVETAIVDGVATVTLNSPSNRNALSAVLRAQLLDTLRAVMSDESVRVVILTNTGPTFCSGADLSEVGRASGPADDFIEVLQLLWQGPKPVVGVARGAARGGGLGLLAACDIALASQDSHFAFSEVRVGAVPAAISLVVLPRLLPRAANELLLTAEPFDANRAVAIGLLTKSVPSEQLNWESRHYVELLMLGGPEALSATKHLLRHPAEDFRDAADLAELSHRHFTSAEGREGVAAFREKRPPRWAPIT